MDFSRAFVFITEDKQWVGKLVPLVMVMLLALIPLVGILALAVGLGFMLQIAINVREGLPRPLPRWDDWSTKFNLGAQILLAMLIWNLPIIILSACSSWLAGAIGSGFAGSFASLVLWCCALPFLLMYFAFAWSLLAVGVTEFIETGENATMYRPLHLWDVASANNEWVIQWVTYATLTNLLLVVLLAIPCLGWLAALALAMPLHGHLLGQFAQKLAIRNQPKPRKKKKPNRT